MDRLLQMILRCCQEAFSPSSTTNTQTLALLCLAFTFHGLFSAFFLGMFVHIMCLLLHTVLLFGGGSVLNFAVLLLIILINT